MIIRKNLQFASFILAFVLLALPACAEEGYWKFSGERLVEGKPFRVSAADTSAVRASASGSSIAAVHSWSGHRSSATYAWTADGDLARLMPGVKIKFTGTVTHSGELSGSGGITLQPFGMAPGTGHSSALVIVAGPTSVANRSASQKGELAVPQGPLYPDKKMELRFEVYPGGASSALYRTYEWVAGVSPPAGKSLLKPTPPADPLSAELARLVRQVEMREITARKVFTRGDQTTEMTITFWNYGAIIPGRHKARMRVSVSSSLGTPPMVAETEAEFTGGPNGQFWVKEEGLRTRMVLRDGEVIVGGQAGEENDEIPVITPKAFDDWPADIKNLNDYLRKVNSLNRLMRRISEILSAADNTTRSIIASYR